MNTARLPRRLGLAAGLLLALAIPSVASASATVEADRLPEGNAGSTQLQAQVKVTCDNKDAPNHQFGTSEEDSCLFYVSYDEAASQAKRDSDVQFSAQRATSIKVGQSEVIPMTATIIGDKFPELDEKLAITVRTEGTIAINGCVWEVCQPRLVQTFDVSKTFEAGTVLNDDGPLPRNNIKIKSIGKVKAPVRAAESAVERYPWEDGTSTGANCITKETYGFNKAFGAW